MKAIGLVRAIDFNHYFEIFLVSAITSIIGIRFYLQLTGFPQLGGGDLHIAHMLWGGLLLIIALLGSLLFLNNDLKLVWAVVGGAGFGTFIDEVGKFVTKDNNYFFQPTFALIYAIFIILYLFYKTFIAKRKFSKQEYLINSIEELKEVITNELDSEEIDKALKYISLSDKKNPVTQFLKHTFIELKTLPHQPPNPYHRFRKRTTHLYLTLISKPWFINGISIFFIISALEYLYRGADLLFEVAQQPLVVLIERLANLDRILPILYAIGVTTHALFIIVGVALIHKSRKRSYTLFKNAILVSIFILQMYNFYRLPVMAFFLTLRDVLIFSILEYMIQKEKDVVETKQKT